MKISKKAFLLYHLKPMILLFILLVQPSLAYSQSKDPKWRVFAGGKSLFVDYEFAHDTHPDDPFLSNANVPGSAGTTGFDKRFWYFTAGGGVIFSKNKITYIIDLGILFGKERDIQQNVNDPRPPSNAAFIYSEFNWGMFTSFSLDYKLNGLVSAGGAAQLAGVFIESGWDRFNKDQEVENKLQLFLSAGPKLSLDISRLFRIEGTVLFGSHVDYGILGVIRF